MAVSADPVPSSSTSELTLLREGVVAGLLGAVAVMVVFGIYDWSQGSLFRTPSVLNAVFFQNGAADQVEPRWGLAAGYAVVHGLLWIAAGLAAAVLARITEDVPKIWYAMVVLVTVLFCAIVWGLARIEIPGLGYHHLWVGALLGSGTMLAYLSWRHPSIAHHLD